VKTSGMYIVGSGKKSLTSGPRANERQRPPGKNPTPRPREQTHKQEKARERQYGQKKSLTPPSS